MACKEAIETLQHVFLECTIYAECRDSCMDKVRLVREGEVWNLIENLDNHDKMKVLLGLTEGKFKKDLCNATKKLLEQIFVKKKGNVGWGRLIEINGRSYRVPLERFLKYFPYLNTWET